MTKILIYRKLLRFEMYQKLFQIFDLSKTVEI